MLQKTRHIVVRKFYDTRGANTSGGSGFAVGGNVFGMLIEDVEIDLSQASGGRRPELPVEGEIFHLLLADQPTMSWVVTLTSAASPFTSHFFGHRSHPQTEIGSQLPNYQANPGPDSFRKTVLLDPNFVLADRVPVIVFLTLRFPA